MNAVLRCELFPVDLDRAVEFYVGVLAFHVVRDERHSDAPYVALERGQVRLGLAQRPDVVDRGARRPPVGVELVMEVDDLSADRQRIGLAGWPLVEDLTPRPWGLTDFRFLDPDGFYWRITTGPRSSPERTPAGGLTGPARRNR